jgi:sulfonate transport system substrate-binding protein
MSPTFYRREANRYRLLAADADLQGAEQFRRKAALPVPTMERALSRRSFGVLVLNETVIAEQQQIADTFKRLGLIPVAITVSDAVLKTAP